MSWESMTMKHWVFDMKLIFGVFDLHEWSKYQRTADVSFLIWSAAAEIAAAARQPWLLDRRGSRYIVTPQIRFAFVII